MTLQPGAKTDPGHLNRSGRSCECSRSSRWSGPDTYLWWQLILVNLLIAMMSSTYAEIKHVSNRQWLMDVYTVTREFSR